MRLALLHGLEREPHARALAAAQSLARLVVHADDTVGMHDFRSGLEVRIALEPALMCATSPKKMKLTAGYRSSARAAPGMTTVGP